VYKHINKCKIKNWKEAKHRADWEKYIREAKIRVGLCCHLRRRRRRKEGIMYKMHKASRLTE
jgi:hypothetical protein